MLNFIVNPVSGNKKAIKNMKIIGKFLTEKNIAYSVYSTNEVGSAGIIAGELERKGVDNIIAVGGDGTLSEILNGLKNPNSINLGIIPSGTGNDFASCCKISLKPLEAIKTILKNHIVKVDYLQGQDFRGINVIGSGLDIEVLKKYSQAKRHNKLTYFTSLLKVLKNFDFYNYKIYVDGEIYSNSEYMIAACCNGTRFGGGMKISPYSSVTDGKINLVLIKKINKKKILPVLIKFMRGKHLNTNFGVEVLCENVKIEGAQSLNIDGEIIDMPFELKIVHNGLNFYLN